MFCNGNAFVSQRSNGIKKQIFVDLRIALVFALYSARMRRGRGGKYNRDVSKDSRRRLTLRFTRVSRQLRNYDFKLNRARASRRLRGSGSVSFLCRFVDSFKQYVNAFFSANKRIRLRVSKLIHINQQVSGVPKKKKSIVRKYGVSSRFQSPNFSRASAFFFFYGTQDREDFIADERWRDHGGVATTGE